MITTCPHISRSLRPLACHSAIQERFQEARWHQAGVRAAAGGEESNPLLIIHLERCCRICSSFMSCFIIYELLSIIWQTEKSRMQARLWLTLLKPGCLCPVAGLQMGDGCRCDISVVALCWHRWKSNENIVTHRSKLKLFWQGLRVSSKKPLILRLFHIFIITVNSVLKQWN